MKRPLKPISEQYSLPLIHNAYPFAIAKYGNNGVHGI